MFNINISILKKLPLNSTIIRETTCLDMDEIPRQAIVVQWVDKGLLREAYYDIATGEYLGEAR